MPAKKIATANHNEDGENDFYTELKQARNIDALTMQIVKIIKRLGFSDYIFMPLEVDWDQEIQQHLLSTYPKDFWKKFRDKKLYTLDILNSFFQKNTHPIYTSNIYNYYCNAPFENDLVRTNRSIRQLYHALGFLENYTIPIPGNADNNRFLFTLSKKNMDPEHFQTSTNKVAPQLYALGQAIYKVCNARFPTLFEKPKKNIIDIAPKPLRVLATLANEDLSITGVANKLCISPITAHQHIAAARRALNKNTNIGAIKEAIGLGLIRYDD